MHISTALDRMFHRNTLIFIIYSSCNWRSSSSLWLPWPLLPNFRRSQLSARTLKPMKTAATNPGNSPIWKLLLSKMLDYLYYVEALSLKMESKSKKVAAWSRSPLKPLEPHHEAATLIPLPMEQSSLPTGLPMRADSELPALTCPLLPRCPITSSRCWLTCALLVSCKLFPEDSRSVNEVNNRVVFSYWSMFISILSENLIHFHHSKCVFLSRILSESR